MRYAIDLSMNRYWRKAERAMLNHRAAMNRNDPHKAWYWMRYAQIYLIKGVFQNKIIKLKKQDRPVLVQSEVTEQDKFEASL